MKLYELFDKTVDWKWTNKNKHNAAFEIETKTYVVIFDEMGGDAYEVMFALQVKSGDLHSDITGTGNEVIVFSTVLAILKDFIKKKKPSQLTFTADEPSRRRLYDRLIKRFAREWDVIITVNSKDTKAYVLNKKE